MIGGLGPQRLAAALAAVRHTLGAIGPADDVTPEGEARRWQCEHCGDPACERHLLRRG